MTFSQRLFVLAIGLAAGGGLASTQTLLTPSTTPVGHWVAEHTSTGGIGSWWEFRSDDTLTMSFGVAVSFHIERSGDSFTSPSGNVGGPPVHTTYSVVNDLLTLDAGGGDKTTYTRIGAAPDPADPLIGKWKMQPRPVDPAANANSVAMQTLMAEKGTYVFTPDGMEMLRVPLGTREGTWDAVARTFQIPGYGVGFTFERKDGKLMLSQPPNGKQIDSYVADPLFAVTRTVTQRGPGVVMPQILHQVEPAFTEEARRRKLKGDVSLEVIVREDGSVRSARVVRSAADAYSDPADKAAARTLDQKAIDAVTQYTFKPGTKSGQAVAVSVNVEVSFQLM